MNLNCIAPPPQSPPSSTPSPPASPWPSLVRSELARVLEAPAFSGAHNARRLLRHLVEGLLSDGGAGFKESVLGIEVFQRPATSFDPARDTIVRVEARRLRQRLARHYGDDGRHAALRIELPVGSYRPRIIEASAVETCALRAAAPPAANEAAAHELIERGDFLLRQGGEPSLRKALARYDEAVQCESSSAAAHLGRARAWEALLAGAHEQAPQALSEAQAALNRSRALDPSDPEALGFAADLQLRYRHDLQHAGPMLAQALAVAPASAALRRIEAHALMLRGRFDDAGRALREARRFDPFDPAARLLEVKLHHYRRDRTAAQAALRALQDLSPAAIDAFDEALMQQRPACRINRPASAWRVALVKLAQHDDDAAFDWLDRSAARNEGRVIALGVEPLVDRLRSDPRFAELLRRLGLGALMTIGRGETKPVAALPLAA